MYLCEIYKVRVFFSKDNYSLSFHFPNFKQILKALVDTKINYNFHDRGKEGTSPLLMKAIVVLEMNEYHI